MPIDTSSYYPEVNGPENNNDDRPWLNRPSVSLFGDKPKEPQLDKMEENETYREESQTPPPPVKESKGYKIADLGARFLSWLLSPMLMPVYGIILVFGLSVLDVISPGLRVAFIFIIAGINFVIPLLFLVLLKILGEISDMEVEDRRQRFMPYIIGVICLGITAWFVSVRGAPLWLTMFFTGGAVAAFINMIINFKWKISAHAAGIAGIIALLIKLEKDMAVEPRLFIWLLITIGAAGLLGSCRIWLGKHTVWQVLAGYAVGFCSVFFMMYIK